MCSLSLCFLHLISPFPQGEKLFFRTRFRVCWSPTQLVCSESIFVTDKANAILHYMCAKEKEAISPDLYNSRLTQTTIFLTSSSPISDEEWTAYELSAPSLFGPSTRTYFGPSWQQSCRKFSISIDWVAKLQFTCTFRNVYPRSFGNLKLIFWMTKTPTSYLLPSPSDFSAIPSISFFLISVILLVPPKKIWSHCNLIQPKINQPPLGPFPSLHPVIFHPKT